MSNEIIRFKFKCHRQIGKKNDAQRIGQKGLNVNTGIADVHSRKDFEESNAPH